MSSAQDQQAKSTMTKSSLFTVLSNLIDADYQQGSTYSGEPVSITLMDSNDNVNGDINLAALINPDDELQLVVRFVNTDIDEAHSWVESLLNQIGLENNCEIIDEGEDTDNTITAIFILDDFSDVNNIEVQETDAENNINTLDLVTDIDKINEAENILQNIVTTNNINFNSDGVIETNNTNFNDNTDNDDNSCNDDEKINTEEISTEEKISINNEINDTNEQLQKNINSEQINFEQNLSEQNQLSQIDSEEDNLQNEILQSDSNMNNVEMNNIEEQDNNKDNEDNEDVEKQNSNEEQNSDEEQNNDEDEDESIEINEELRKAMSNINPNINMYYSMPTKNELTNNISARKIVTNLETEDNIDTNDDNSDINDNNVEIEIINTDNNIKEEVNDENIIIASNKKIIIANNNNSVIPTAIPAIPSASSASTNSATVVSTQVQTKAKTKTKSTRKSKTTNQQQTNLNNITMPTTSATSVTPAVMGMSIKGLSNRVSATTADGRILSAAGQVKEMLDEITANNTMTTALLANLQDVAICKDKMKLSYPLLMKVNPNMAYKDQALFNGKKRYGKCIITYCSEDFYVTNHIFATNVPKIRSYLESLNLIKKSTHSVTVTNPAILKQQAIQNLINQKTGITSVTPLATPTDITASTLQQVNSSTSTSTDIQSQSQS